MMLNVLIVRSPYYEDVARELLRGAETALNEAGVRHDEVAVPGALEIPAAIAMAEEANPYDGYVALGCVVRGETGHYDVVAGESARGLMALSMDGLAIGNGVLTCENLDQAMARARVDGGNKGGDAAKAALAMIDVRERMGPRER